MARSTRRLNAEAARRSVAFPWHFRGVSCAACRVARRTRSLAARGTAALLFSPPHRRSDVRNRVRCFAIEPNQRASRNVNSSSIAPSRSVAWETSVRISLFPPPPPPFCPLVCLCLVRLSCSTSSDRFPIVSSGDQRRPVVPVYSHRAHTRIVPLLERVHCQETSRVRLPKRIGR